MRVSQILDKIDENQELGKSNVRLVAEKLRYSMLLVNSSEYKEGCKCQLKSVALDG
jgi:hypothetical protein